MNLYVRIYLFKRAQNWQNIHSKYQKCNDIHSLNDLEVYIYQQFVHQIFWKVLEASFEHSRYSVEHKLNSLHHDFESTFHIDYRFSTDSYFFKTCSQRTFRKFKKILTLNRKKIIGYLCTFGFLKPTICVRYWYMPRDKQLIQGSLQMEIKDHHE